jgi:hypothetical protein
MKIKNITTKHLASEIVYYDEIDSTQLEIWRRVESNTIKSGTVIIANTQTNGIRNARQSMAHRRRK